MKSKSQEIGNQLKLIRKQLSKTQLDFAQKIGIERHYYSKIENGKINLSIEYLENICQKLKLELDIQIQTSTPGIISGIENNLTNFKLDSTGEVYAELESMEKSFKEVSESSEFTFLFGFEASNQVHFTQVIRITESKIKLYGKMV